MASISSTLSHSVLAVVSANYTTKELVSRITGGEVKPEEVLDEWIMAACEEIDRRTGMSFRFKEFINVLDGSGTNTIFLDCFPITEIHSIEINGSVVPASCYTVNKKTGIIKLKDMFISEGIGNVIVKGIEGYSKVPPLIQKIATLITAKTALEAKFGALIDNENIGNFSQTRSFKKLNDELDRSWQALGSKFRVYIL